MQALSELSFDKWCLAMLKCHVRSWKVIAQQTTFTIIIVIHCRVWSH